MPRPKRIELSLLQRLERMEKAGLLRVEKNMSPTEDDQLPDLNKRLKAILGIVKNHPVKATTMNYLILYDIENNKVRRLVSKYLIKEGCIRVQKSVFMANSQHAKFHEIYQTLQDINSFYENEDSIILVPVNVADVRSMKLIGQNVNIEMLTDPPTTLFV